MSERYLASVEKLLKRKLGKLILQKMNDPRVNMVTITKLDVTPDLKEARVGMTVLDRENHDEEKMLQVMQDARGFLQSEIGRTTDIKNIPQLEFYLDDSIDKSIRINALIQEAIEEDRQMMQDENDNTAETDSQESG